MIWNASRYYSFLFAILLLQGQPLHQYLIIHDETKRNDRPSNTDINSPAHGMSLKRKALLQIYTEGSTEIEFQISKQIYTFTYIRWVISTLPLGLQSFEFNIKQCL